MGLKHAGAPGRFADISADRDAMAFTVMSDRSHPGAPDDAYSNEAGGFAQTLMRLDIAALQHLYGPNYGFRGGDTTYAWDPATGEMRVDGLGTGAPAANRIFATLWDGGGRDLYDLSAYDGGVGVDLRAGRGSTFDPDQLARLAPGVRAPANVFNAWLHQGDRRALIEDAAGGDGGDVIHGNAVANALSGGRGADALHGHGGRDVLLGGDGRDRLFGGPGQDTLRGGAKADVITGGPGDDILHGGEGADRFVFAAAHPGDDLIRDFGWGADRLDFRGMGLAPGDLDIRSDGPHTVIAAGALTVTLAFTDPADLGPDDFLF